MNHADIMHVYRPAQKRRHEGWNARHVRTLTLSNVGLRKPIYMYNVRKAMQWAIVR